MTDTTQPAPNPLGLWAPALVSTGSDGLQACTEACTSWQEEIARFVDQRSGANQRSFSALMSARDFADVFRVQQDWALQAATDYTEEATRLTRLFTTLSLTGTTPAVQQSASLVG
mgnify:CR=1 FL=1